MARLKEGYIFVETGDHLSQNGRNARYEAQKCQAVHPMFPLLKGMGLRMDTMVGPKGSKEGVYYFSGRYGSARRIFWPYS